MNRKKCYPKVRAMCVNTIATRSCNEETIYFFNYNNIVNRFALTSFFRDETGNKS